MMKLKVAVTSGAFVYDKKLLKASLRKAGLEVANNARALIRQKIGGGRMYRGSGGGASYRGYKKGAYTASLAGNPPASVTGSLARSIKVVAFKSGEGVAIRDTMFYALFLEAGTQGGGGGGKRGSKRKRGARQQRASGAGGVKPRPFLSTALDGNAGFIATQIDKAVLAGLGWRQKPA